MIYVLAAIGALTVAVLMWKAFGPEMGFRRRGQAPIAPDDDPDFLRRIDEEQRRQRHDEE
ncbi:hypothetical protein [Saccharopolyspora cebuensis]|uniref:Secreted protein n=1 Tax=Saccharopolyspora cebuensis TaxID=418759 RepID=A0ABV4CNM2_9PSEU